MEYFHKQLAWSKNMMNQAIDLMYEILQAHFKQIINIKETPLEIDRTFATDLVLLTFNSNSIAVRMRRLKICGKYRDLTIQTQQASGNRYNTEYVKIFEKGYVRWYLYCWVRNDKIREWMFIDLDILRDKKLIENYDEITNKNDNQRFKAIPLEILLKNNCIIDYHLNGKKSHRKELNNVGCIIAFHDKKEASIKKEVKLSDFF